MIYYRRSGNIASTAKKGSIKDNDILNGLCKISLHFYVDRPALVVLQVTQEAFNRVEQAQDECHAKFVAKALVEQVNSAATRKAVPVDLLVSDSEQIFVHFRVRSRVYRGYP